MTVLQFRGPITFCVLQWCHPMLTRTLWRTSCSARMIALYGDRKRIQARANTSWLTYTGNITTHSNTSWLTYTGNTATHSNTSWLTYTGNTTIHSNTSWLTYTGSKQCGFHHRVWKMLFQCQNFLTLQSPCVLIGSSGMKNCWY